MIKRSLTCQFAILALLAMVACGGGGSNSTNTITGASSAPVTVNIGDATADRLLAFEVAVNSVTLTGANGTANTGNLLAAPSKVELTHLSGKFEPLRLMGIPAGSYSGATIQLGSAEAVIVGAAGTGTAGQIQKVQNIVPNPGTITVTFTTVTVGGTASVLNFDFNLGSSVAVNGNIVSFTPSPTSITVAANQAGQVEDEQENETGELEDIHGTVTALGTNNFTIALENNSQSLQFTVGDATQTSFSDGIASFADIKVGMVVKVEGVTKADGSLFAKEVEGVEIQNGMETEGIITATNLAANPATITMVVHESSSASTTQPATDDTVTVTIDANTRFKAPDFGHGKTKIQDPQLPFDAAHLGKGQKVEVDDDTARTNNLSAHKLQLKKQALVGTVSNASQNGFTLTLDGANSFFSQLTGETTIQVLTTSKTLVKGAAAANAQTIRVRGLLFFNPAGTPGNKYTMAAGRTDH